MNDRKKMYELDRMNANSIFEDRRSGLKTRKTKTGRREERARGATIQRLEAG